MFDLFSSHLKLSLRRSDRALPVLGGLFAGSDLCLPLIEPRLTLRQFGAAALHPDLAVDLAFLILRKGMHSAVDSYSAFIEADGKTTTGLAALLNARGVKRVFACGLATDFCVAHSALDARNAGFETFVIEDACRAIDANNSLAEAWARMNAAEVWRVQSAEILG